MKMRERSLYSFNGCTEEKLILTVNTSLGTETSCLVTFSRMSVILPKRRWLYSSFAEQSRKAINFGVSFRGNIFLSLSHSRTSVLVLWVLEENCDLLVFRHRVVFALRLGHYVLTIYVDFFFVDLVAGVDVGGAQDWIGVLDGVVFVVLLDHSVLLAVWGVCCGRLVQASCQT